MRILFYLHTLTLGGAQRSALTFARELRRRGHQAVFTGEVREDGFTKVLEENGFKYFDLLYSTKPFTVRHIASRLSRICREAAVDICHSFFYATHYCSWLAYLFYPMPVLAATFCGGAGPRCFLPRLSRVIAFSGELKQVLVTRRNWHPDMITVSAARIESPTPDEPSREEARAALFPGLDLDPSLFSVLMVSRLSKDKHGSLRHVLALAQEIANRDLPWQIVLVGGGPMAQQIETEAAELSKLAKRTVLALAGPQALLSPYYRAADLTLGVGRSVLDGMVRGIPAVIVGEAGFAGLFREDNAREIAYFNFSGRNQRKDSEIGPLVSALTELTDPARRNEAGNFQQEYIRNEMSVERGVDCMLSYYDELMRSEPPSRYRVVSELTRSAASLAVGKVTQW